MIFYTADLHLGHTKIIGYCNRPFADTEEMNETIVTNWNSVIKDDDDVYVIGDIGFSSSGSDGLIHISRLKGKKHLIIGNHDIHQLKKGTFRSNFVSVDNYLEISDKGRKTVLFHYPIAEWNGYFRGFYHVYGHIHNSNDQTAAIMASLPNAFNAGVDVNGFYPKTLDQLIAEKNEKTQI